MAKVARVWDGSEWVVLSPATINPYPSQTGNSGKFLSTDGSAVSWQTVDLSSKANINSPEFTGIPTAPTAAPGTNSTQIATTGFVYNEISLLIDAAPAALNTLNELAAALGDDANFATTITNAVSGKEPSIPTGTTQQYWRGDKSWQTLDKNAVGLSNVENTALSTWAGSTNITTVGTLTNLTVTNTITGSITGNAGTVTNGVYTTGSYSNPSWITSLSETKVLPSQTGNSGKYLTTNGTSTSWTELNVSFNSPSFTGTPTAPTPPTGNNSTRIATTEFVQKTLEITQLDTFTFDGKTLRFLPTYLGQVVEIDHPLRLLLNINGIIQIVAEKPSTVWLSGMASYGYYIDDEGYVVLPEPPEPGSYFEARLFPGVDLQKRPETYPFRAIDIYLGD